MAWTETTRPRYERPLRRYASDLTDREWVLIAPFLPPAKLTGRPRKTGFAMLQMLYCTSPAAVVHGVCCPMIFRPCPRRATISTAGAIMVFLT